MSRMIYKSRVKNSKRNIVSGLAKQIVSIGLQFAIRTVIIYSLGAEYQGVSGLFTSILSVLNLSDLGFSAAVTYILYRPIAEGNQKQINGVLSYLKKIYCIIGTAILCLGGIIMPFLTKLVADDYPPDINIYVLFLIYIINSAISYYLFAYKNALLTAYQREDIVSNAYTITLTISRGLQLLLLLLFRNYYVYAVILPLGSIFNNILVQSFSKKYFPESIPEGEIEEELKIRLNRQVRAVFVNRISDVARNSFDNIVISSYLGLIAVTVYDNYFYIYSAIVGIMGIVIHGVRSSIGNSMALESVEKNSKDISTFTFIFMWISGWCTTCLFCLYQPFMMIWMKEKEELVLSFFDMSLFCFYFYAMCMTYSKNAFLEARGLYKECEKWYISEAIANLVLNVILGKIFGITGILLATLFTIVFFNFLCGTRVLFNIYFKTGEKQYFAAHCIYLVVTVISALTTYFMCSQIDIGGTLGLIIKMAICTVAPNLMFLLAYGKTEQFIKAKAVLQKALKR